MSGRRDEHLRRRQRVAELEAEAPAVLLVADLGERVTPDRGARLAAVGRRREQAVREVERGGGRDVEELPEVERADRLAPAAAEVDRDSPKPSASAAPASATGRYLTFLATQNASKFAIVPPEVRCPQARSGGKPTIAASRAATSSSSRVVTGDPSSATLFGL